MFKIFCRRDPLRSCSLNSHHFAIRSECFFWPKLLWFSNVLIGYHKKETTLWIYTCPMITEFFSTNYKGYLYLSLNFIFFYLKEKIIQILILFLFIIILRLSKRKFKFIPQFLPFVCNCLIWESFFTGWGSQLLWKAQNKFCSLSG